jgi:hypothetical protein
MSRILKRPMFRMGGSTENMGIMDGMRQRYEKAGLVEERLSELDRLAPLPKPRVTELLQNIGLNILSNPSEGNIFRTAAKAARDPLQQASARDFQAALLRRGTVGDILSQRREQRDKERLLQMRIDADREIAGIQSKDKQAELAFPNITSPFVKNNLMDIINDKTNIIDSDVQVIMAPAKQQIKQIQSLNPKSGDFFVLVDSQGRPERFVRVELDEKNRVKLREVDPSGNDLDDEDAEPVMGDVGKTYRERIAKDLEKRREQSAKDLEESLGVEDRDILQP